jgi:p70 ribosomal S6 kinase/serum/glucocorticoid-regulated kinase 1/serum/glucocorticoid-regulated kinase 2
MEGGELYVHLKESGKFNVERTREYAAEILLALEYIHKKGIIYRYDNIFLLNIFLTYRDLKLENVLMDKDGYIKLADFGLAKIN